MTSLPAPHLARWRVGLALALVYLSWGTTYLAIREGVKTLPPCLFGGLRVFLAGLILLAYLKLSGRKVRLSGRDTAWAWLVGACLFVGGNGLINVAEKDVPSAITSVLVATTPLWMALMELAWPTGDQLSARGWLGLLAGLGGVALLVADHLRAPAHTIGPGYLLVLASSLCWSLGALLHRHGPATTSLLAAAAWQMVLGGGSLASIGMCLGEAQRLTPAHLTLVGVGAFFYLLVVGSLVGFVAFTWLLGHVSTALAGSYAYVNPLVALLVGWLIAGETLTVSVIAGMVVILGGVALVRTGGARRAVSTEYRVRSTQYGVPSTPYRGPKPIALPHSSD